MNVAECSVSAAASIPAVFRAKEWRRVSTSTFKASPGKTAIAHPLASRILNIYLLLVILLLCVY